MGSLWAHTGAIGCIGLTRSLAEFDRRAVSNSTAGQTGITCDEARIVTSGLKRQRGLDKRFHGAQLLPKVAFVRGGEFSQTT